MDIVLIANGLTDRGEHSYRLIADVRAALARRGIGSSAYAAKRLDPAIAAEGLAAPHFHYALYDSIGPRLADGAARKLASLWPVGEKLASYPAEVLSYAILNRSFRRDLEALPQKLLRPDNLLVVTAACQNQLAGLVDFLGACEDAERLPVAVCQLMFPPSWTPWERTAHLGGGFYGRAFQRAAPLIGRKLFFTTENEAVGKIYRDAYGIETQILPVPFARRAPPHRQSDRIRLGFFGYSKSAKGFHLLPDAAALCREAGLDVEFRIQIQHSQWEEATVAAERRLRAMPNVRLIEGVLDAEDYLAETGKADIILLPYDPVQFGMRGSGIFTESVAAGRPIIASEGTFAAESIKKGEAQGEIFAPYDARRLADAIARILPQIPQLRARAAAQAEAFADRHSADVYVDVFLALKGSIPNVSIDKTVEILRPADSIDIRI